MVGIGFRRDIADDIISGYFQNDFIEVSPENWIGLGGFWKRKLDQVAEKYPIHAHGLSMSLGSYEPLDVDFLRKTKEFLDRYDIGVFSEHLSFNKVNNAHIYELLPIPFTQQAATFIAQRIQQAQEYLQRTIAIENVSYYTPTDSEMTEVEFINTILQQSGCNLLLDINNVYVNAFNHGYDAHDFLSKLDHSHTAYVHIAGHDKVAEDLIIDTHGQPINSEVFSLLEYILPDLGEVPILLERDFNFEEKETLKSEFLFLKELVQKHKQIGNDELAAY